MDDIFTMRLNEPYFSSIYNGKKKYEIRINDEKRRELEVGNLITFICRDDPTKQYTCEIEQLLYFDTFVELFNNIRKEDCGFKSTQTADEIEDLFLKFRPARGLNEQGIVAIKIKRINFVK